MHKNYRHAPQPKVSSVPAWIFVAVAFLGGYLASVLFDWNSIKAAYQSWVKPSPKKPPEQPLVAVKPQFEFYTLLTQKEPEVVVDEKAPQAVTEQKIVVTQDPPQTEQFMVQLAAFNNQAEAEKMRASLAIKGVATRVIASEQDAHQWYRVIAGPYANKEEAVAAQHTIIQKEGIRGIIRKA